MTRSEKRARIPPFRSDQEERDFWAHHSVEEFAEGLMDLEIEIRPPRTQQIALVPESGDDGSHSSCPRPTLKAASQEQFPTISGPQGPSPAGSPGASDAKVRSAGLVHFEHPIG